MKLTNNNNPNISTFLKTITIILFLSCLKNSNDRKYRKGLSSNRNSISKNYFKPYQVLSLIAFSMFNFADSTIVTDASRSKVCAPSELNNKLGSLFLCCYDNKDFLCNQRKEQRSRERERINQKIAEYQQKRIINNYKNSIPRIIGPDYPETDHNILKKIIQSQREINHLVTKINNDSKDITEMNLLWDIRYNFSLLDYIFLFLYEHGIERNIKLDEYKIDKFLKLLSNTMAKILLEGEFNTPYSHEKYNVLVFFDTIDYYQIWYYKLYFMDMFFDDLNKIMGSQKGVDFFYKLICKKLSLEALANYALILRENKDTIQLSKFLDFIEMYSPYEKKIFEYLSKYFHCSTNEFPESLIEDDNPNVFFPSPRNQKIKILKRIYYENKIYIYSSIIIIIISLSLRYLKNKYR